MKWEILEKEIGKYTPKNRDLIYSAYKLTEACHEGPQCKNKKNHINHSLKVANSIINLGLDAETAAASLIYGAIKECDYPIEKVEELLGKEIAFLVGGANKLGEVKYTDAQRKVESLRKMFLAIAEDIRVVMIKIYDRLNSMQLIKSIPYNKQRRLALETLELYAPIAYRIGLWETKGQLEDLSFAILNPKEYELLRNEVKERMSERKNYLKKLIPIIVKNLKKENIDLVDINTRAKHYYSLWKKLKKHDMDFGSIYDLAALRIIVPSVNDCYAALGIIHKLWKPLPGRIKDYIALSKPNGYRSLHTTIMALDKRVIEIQIRTPEMHEEAELGISAHWLYDEKGKSSTISKKNNKQAILVKYLHKWQKDFSNINSKEVYKAYKIDFFKDRIFVSTPKGEIIDLPEGSTPVDFAYSIHTDIGNHMSGAKVNGKFVSFSQELNSGDNLEILAQKNKKPSPDWLESAKTPLAISQIRTELRKAGIKFPKPLKEKKKKEELIMTVSGEDRVGILKDISTLLAEENINILKTNTGPRSRNNYVITFIFRGIKGKKLEHLITQIREIEGIDSVDVSKQ